MSKKEKTNVVQEAAANEQQPQEQEAPKQKKAKGEVADSADAGTHRRPVVCSGVSRRILAMMERYK